MRPCQGANPVVAGQDELCAHLDHGAAFQLPRPGPAANTIASFDYFDAVTGTVEGHGCCQSGEPGPDDDYPWIITAGHRRVALPASLSLPGLDLEPGLCRV